METIILSEIFNSDALSSNLIGDININESPFQDQINIVLG